MLFCRCMVKALICQTSFQPRVFPCTPLFAGHQSDELLLHYRTTTHLSIAPCSLLSFLKSHPPLQSIQTLNPMTKLSYRLIDSVKRLPCCILCNIHRNQLNPTASSHTILADLKYLEKVHSPQLVILFTEIRV